MTGQGGNLVGGLVFRAFIPTTTQQLDWYDPEALHTKAYEQRLLVELVNTTLQDVACKEDVSYDALLGILDPWMATTVDWTTIEPFTTLGMDEISLLTKAIGILSPL